MKGFPYNFPSDYSLAWRGNQRPSEKRAVAYNYGGWLRRDDLRSMDRMGLAFYSPKTGELRGYAV